MSVNHKPRLIVLGGGFAGLQLIENIKKDQFDILLIDQLNHHQFQPLFYQVATSQIEPSSISFPFRKIFQDRKDVRIRLTKAISIDPDSKVIATGIGDFEFDFWSLPQAVKQIISAIKILKIHLWVEVNLSGNQYQKQHIGKF